MILRMGFVRNVTAIILVSIFLLESITILLSTCSSAGGIAVWPPDITVDMGNKFPEGEIKFNIQVSNRYTNDINILASIENQIPHHLRGDYTNFPDLSWITITPNDFILPGMQSKILEVTITIPDEEKSLHYNERWEACIVIAENKDTDSVIAVEYAIEIYTKTPERAELPISNALLFFLGAVGAIAVVAVCISYIRRRKTAVAEKNVAFYFKKRKEKNKEKR